MTAMKVLRRASISRASRVGGPAAIALLASVACLAAAASASAESAIYSTYSAEQSVPVPPASNFKGNGGGDGWAVALSKEAVYNVFHHQQTIQVACHYQKNAEPCFPTETISEPGTNAEFASSGQPGLYLNQTTGKLYVYATRLDDSTAGVVCINTEEAKTNPDPFCGFTELSAKGDAPPQSGDISGTSNPMLVGQHWYAFSYVSGSDEHEGTKNTLLCFDVSTGEACTGQPFDVALGGGTVLDSEPSPATTAIGGKVIIPVDVEGTSRLACFDDSTQSSCGGKWPVTLNFGYASEHGASFPLLDTTGKIIGLCLPTGTDQCFNLEGEETTTPSGLPSVVTSSTPWNGPAFVLGPRVYVPNGNTEEVECFDYSKDEGCEHFPKTFPSFPEFYYLYTVNPDPQRPTCIWVNSDADDGMAPVQIVSFDAYTGEACGQGTIRVLASQFVAPAPQCKPANYVSLQVLEPARSTYSEGTVAFANGDGELIPGLPELTLDETGSASLNGLDLNTTTGLPQFLFTLKNPTGPVGSVEVRLTWEGNYDESCVDKGQTVVRPPAPTAATTTTATPSAAGVLPFTAAAPKACTSKREFTIHIQNAKRLGLVSAVVEVDGKKAKTLRGTRLSTAINLVGLPQGAFTVEIVGRRRDGRTVKGERVYHTCVPKLPGHAYLPL